MIALDTNVLLRFITGDEPVVAAAVRRFLQQQQAPLFISTVVLIEMVWTLQKRYKFSRASLVATLTTLLRHPQVYFSDKPLLQRTLADYSAGNADFADYFIRNDAQQQGASPLYTLDKTAAAEQGFVALPLVS
jgi:predicted nucleic-acid-binding protein